MREILFRGQLRRKGEKVNMAGEPLPSIWIYGGVAQYGNGAVIYQSEPEIKKYPVYADTVGQYTGLKDKNGVKIFEGDIVLKRTRFKKEPREVVFSFGTFHCGFGSGSSTAEHPYTLDDKQIEVVGNIYDNPELMEVQHERD